MRSGEREQVAAEPARVSVGDKRFHFPVGLFPHWNRSGEHTPALLCEYETPAAPIGFVYHDLYEASALERLQRGGERSAVHSEQRSDGRHRRRLRAIERHHQRELPVGEAVWPEGLVEPPGESARRPLRVETEARVANPECGFKRDGHDT